ncbi:MAG TPA: type II secretion system F family protein [Acidimicrobiales bacterium]|nr:type II secretion system F family protein [Acidimicrobiales bacterium]
MSRVLILCAFTLWSGVALALSDTRWARRVSLARRLDDSGGRPRPSTLERLAEHAGTAGTSIARILGVRDDLATRLERAHSPLDPTAVRLQQIGWCVGGLALGVLVATATGAAPGVAVLITLTPAALGFLLVEHRVTRLSDSWKRRVALELPVVTEQLAMLLGAGYALGPALGRLADRANGACAHDFRRVLTRVSQGLSMNDALREWAALVDVSAARRLVSILALDRETADLGRLIAEEATAMRREAHRDLIAVVERRNQQVWIPVTVAALVPGAILLAIPFMAAMQLFARP